MQTATKTKSNGRAKVRPIQWPALPIETYTDVARRRTWVSICDRYRVTESHPLLGGRKKANRYADVVYAEYRKELPEHGGSIRSVWSIVSRHRKRQPAFDALEVFHRQRAAEGL